MKKYCRQCEQDVRRADFYRHPKTADKLQAVCKSCHRANVRKHRAENVEYYREFDRQRANLPHRVAAREAYAQTPQGREKASQAKRAFVARNPAKRAAHIAVSNALRDGKLARQPCEVCGNPKSQAHHDDYGKPLDVRWLCTTHHADWHKHNDPVVPEEQAA